MKIIIEFFLFICYYFNSGDNMKDYINYFKNVIERFLKIDPFSLLAILILFLIIHIFLALTIDKVRESKGNKKSFIYWIPVINIYYLGKHEIHDLYGMIMIIETIFMIPFPHKVHGVSTISTLISSEWLFILLIIETIIAYVIMIINWIKEEDKIKIVR